MKNDDPAMKKGRQVNENENWVEKSSRKSPDEQKVEQALSIFDAIFSTN